MTFDQFRDEIEEAINDRFNDLEGVYDYEDNLSDVEADAMTLESCGWGTDEDYGYFGDDGMDW